MNLRLLATCLAACAVLTSHSIAGTLPATVPTGPAPPVLMLGEVHDNAVQHALRLKAFEDLLATGAKPALLMEQFDRERQADIDRARAVPLRPDADAIIQAGGASKGWNWDFYRPFIALALANDLPIVAANVSRRDAQRVMTGGLAPSGFEPQVPADIAQAHADEISGSHCGMVDAATARRMATAQAARDQFMAREIEANAARGVVLLAGNGHVRKDTGVARWLSPATRARSTAVGFLEEGDPNAAAFDRVTFTPAQTREDPCAAMRRGAPMGAMGATGAASGPG
ncbi:ChaN family lipoprotein [soil metagenome]